MIGQKSFFDIIKWKLVGSVAIGAVLWFVSGALGFSVVFQIMFVVYAVLGFVVFVLLDLPPMPELSGGKAVAGIVVFFLLCSAVYTAAGIYLPQFDPEWEKGKIHKIIEAKKRAHPAVSPRELSLKTGELTAKTDELMERLAKLEETMTGRSSAVEAPSAEELAKKRAAAAIGGVPSDPIAYGKEVYDLYECYNCHKIGGKGGVKKRGPILDNIGNIATAEQLKKKIFEPMTFMTEGFEKEFKKKLMPKNYPELMTDEELDVLVQYLVTLKDANAKTPKLIPQ